MANNADMDDDDIYPENDDYVPQGSRMQDDEEEEGEEVESDSDDDINFITDVKDEPKQDNSSQNLKPAGKSNNDKRPSPAPTPAIKRDGTPQVNINQISSGQNDNQSSTNYPARHTSTLDPLNGNPIHPATGKPILDSNLDTDFSSEASQAWRRPGADITDFFNYGFDEFTWASWCLNKKSMPQEVDAIKAGQKQMEQQMQMMFGGNDPTSMVGGMPQAGPNGMSGMGFQAQQMMDMMSASVMNPQTMTPEQAAAMAMKNMQSNAQQPPSGPSGFQAPQHDNFGGGGGGGGGNRGRGRRGRGGNW